MHDASVVQLGVALKSGAVITDHAADPASFPAGKAVSLNSSSELSNALSAGKRIGVSFGKSQAGDNYTAVCRSGENIPVLAKEAAATGNVTITSYANLVDAGNDEVTVGEVVFVAGSGAVTPGAATFQAASSNNSTATSLAAQINAHPDLMDLVIAEANSAIVTITAKAKGSAGNSIALAYSDKGTATVGATVSGANLDGGVVAADFVENGKAVYIDDVTGECVDENDEDATISNATYASDALSAIGEDGSVVGGCALVDMPGGL